MARARTLPARLTTTLLACLALAPIACQSSQDADQDAEVRRDDEPSPEATAWIPNARPGFATISRSTRYTIVRSESSDLLIFEVEDRSSAGNVRSRLTWLFEIDADAPLQKAIEISPDAGLASAWVLEDLPKRPSHVAPLAGTITITQRTAEALTGVVNVYARTSEPTAGESSGGRVRLARKLEWERRTPTTIEPRDLDTRSGTPELPPEEDKRDWWQHRR